MHQRGLSVRQDSLQGRTAHTKCGLYLLEPSLAAALPGTRRVLARQGWEGEKVAFLSILQEYPPGVSHVPACVPFHSPAGWSARRQAGDRNYCVPKLSFR